MAGLGIADKRSRLVETAQNSEKLPYAELLVQQSAIKRERLTGHFTPTMLALKPLASSCAHFGEHGRVPKPTANRFRQRLFGARGHEEARLSLFHHLGQPSNRCSDHCASIVVSHWNHRAGGNFNVGKNDCIRRAKKVL